ncbi:MAG TPA: adenylate/guanylate cyclase domain-containing protein [Candidatus Binatia bacterium]|nr:adenylate/guanylate cyclase domain-containing protein [Candidatus Binatia bacterium]
MARPPDTRFTRSGDVDIAYQVIGAGARDIVMTMGWVSHLEVMWELPELADFLERLSRLGRLIIFDKRGTGLSDRIAGLATLEQRADDVGAVMDAAGSQQAAFVGWGDGAAIGAMFAATHPERITALVMSSMTVLRAKETIGPDPAILQAMWEVVEKGWGEGNQLDFAAPNHADDPRLRTWWRRWERQSSTPNAAATLLRWGAEIELEPVLRAVQAPTLILERAGAHMIDHQSLTEAARIMPAGRHVQVPGDDLLMFLGDTDPVLGEIAEFLTGAPGTFDPDRTLSTVLFTDLVASTETAGRLGDHRWQNVLRSHHAAVRSVLARYEGIEIDTAGDGFLASFSGPARAVRCACDIRDAIADLGLQVRAGLHTGEVERIGSSIAGLTVHIGARVASLAAASEVLVTSVVKALVLGSGIVFADRGVHSLKGVPDTWQLFAVV